MNIDIRFNCLYTWLAVIQSSFFQWKDGLTHPMLLSDVLMRVNACVLRL